MSIQSFKNKKVLITGGLGFIGSNLAISLVSAGAEVTLIDSLVPEYGGNLFNIDPIKNDVRVNISDVRDSFSVKHLVQGQEYLFNLAGQTCHNDSMTNPYTDLDINAKAQLSIVEACRHHNRDLKLIFASTRQVYGKPKQLPVDENHPINPIDVNGINKVAGEWYHLLYNKVYGIRTTVLRLTNTYGPRMRTCDARQTFLGIWIRKLIEGKPFQIFGDGKQIRDYSYVDDCVDALIRCAESQESDGQVFNLGADDPMSLNETARILSEIVENGAYERVSFPPDRKVIDIGDYYADYRKIRATVNWSPQTKFKEGMKKTIQYYQTHWPKYW